MVQVVNITVLFFQYLTEQTGKAFYEQSPQAWDIVNRVGLR